MMSKGMLESNFLRLAEEIRPLNSFVERGKQTVKKVYELLKKDSEYELVKCKVHGSVGKKIAVFEPRFDCLIYVKGEFPWDKPYKDFLKDFKDVLMLNSIEELPISDVIIEKSCLSLVADGFSLKFVVSRDSVWVEIPGGGNLELHCLGPKFSRLENKLGRNRLNYLIRRDNYRCKEFVGKCQCEFRLGFLRLVKLWYQPFFMHVQWDTGCKETVDVVAYYLVQEHIKNFPNSTSVSVVFRNLLEALENFDNLKIDLPICQSRYPDPPPPIPEELRCQKPLVFDPMSMPPRNLAKVYWNGAKVSKMRKYVADTVSRLIECCAHDGPPTLESVFLMQKAYLFEKSDFNFSVWSISILRNQQAFRQGVYVRNRDRFPADIWGKKFENLIYFLRVMIAVYLSTETNLSPDVLSELLRKCKYFVENFVQEPKNSIDWADGSEGDHVGYDVTLSIPVGIKTRNYIVKISF